MDRDLSSGPVDEQLLSGAVLLPHDQVAAAAPFVVVPPEAGVGVVIAWMRFPILLPKQLQASDAYVVTEPILVIGIA